MVAVRLRAIFNRMRAIAELRRVRSYDCFMTRRLLLVAALMTGCGEPTTTERCDARGDLELECVAAAERACCNTTGTFRQECLVDSFAAICGVDDDVVSSSVDFDACNASLDTFECGPTGIGVPVECKNDFALCNDGGCVEEAWSGAFVTECE